MDFGWFTGIGPLLMRVIRRPARHESHTHQTIINIIGTNSPVTFVISGGETQQLPTVNSPATLPPAIPQLPEGGEEPLSLPEEASDGDVTLED